ncbi:peptide chain release factor N(5)-glutamine methyltransferase [Candidatus Latescibacterota bacterium]
MSDNMKVIELITVASEHLKSCGFENPRLEVERMLGCVIDCSRVELYLNFERPLSDTERDTFRGLFKRRLTHEPLQHILGVSEFKEITVNTDRRALIPRPETELLVDIAVDFLGKTDSPHVADIGTGSGVIALSIAYEIPESSVVAVDISDDALSLARENACLIGVEDRVSFVYGDMLEGLKEMGVFDAILSNPPYIKSGSIPSLQPEVRDYDPSIALDGGNDGLKYLAGLAENADRFLNPGGIVLLECGEGQTQEIKGTFEKTGRYSSVEIIKDLSNNNRIVKAVKRGKEGK